MPLIRNTFYVTESNTHRYQVFYFRHEVWRQIAEPAMMELKVDMFEEVKLDDALQVLRSRKLGFSQVRLLPKGNKLRPIMNLRRRAMTRGPLSKLGRSINTILGPVHSLLKLEKVCVGDRHLGAGADLKLRGSTRPNWVPLCSPSAIFIPD
jgi:telomerase reverse transcriptase